MASINVNTLFKGQSIRYNGGTSTYYPVTGNVSLLEKGQVYEIEDFNVFDFHTDIELEGFEGTFNSVWFDAVE